MYRIFCSTFFITPTMKPVHDVSINLNVMRSILKDCPISSVSQNRYLTKKIIRYVQCHGCEHQLYIDLCTVMGDVEHCCNCIQLRLISDQTNWPHLKDFLEAWLKLLCWPLHCTLKYASYVIYPFFFFHWCVTDSQLNKYANLNIVH